jgi:hypothetical protein
MAEDARGARPRLFRELDRTGKAVRIAAGLFVVLQVTAMLVGGSVPEVQHAFEPVIGFYTSGLRMTNTWGMFGMPPTQTNVTVEGVRADGSVVLLSTTDAHGRSLLERIRDARIRKFEGRLAEDGERPRIGEAFLAYFCRREQEPPIVLVRAKNVLHELRDDDGAIERAPSEQIVLAQPCVGAP